MHKSILIIGFAAALCIGYSAGYLAGTGFSDGPARAYTETPGTAETNSIEMFRTEREQLRQMQVSQLNEMIHGEQTEPSITALAQRRQLELMQWSEQELTLEGVLALRGFEDAVVTLHTDSANVLVRKESVSSQEAAIILELITRETGISAGNVKIIPIN